MHTIYTQYTKMKFCIECSSILIPSVKTGELTFHCKCGKIYTSDANDTLRFEEYMESSESKEKYQTFIDNSAFDPAGYKINKLCDECKMPYLTLIRVGKDEKLMYTCTCGKVYTKQPDESRRTSCVNAPCPQETIVGGGTIIKNISDVITESPSPPGKSPTPPTEEIEETIEESSGLPNVINIAEVSMLKDSYYENQISVCTNNKSATFKSIQEIINTDNVPFYIYSDIKKRLTYQTKCKIVNLNCHLGQRKLALNEIQFYSKYVTDKTLIVYAGSANGEHTPLILELFPNIRLLLIDPHFHNIDEKFQYIYQNLSVLEKDDIDYNIKLFKPSKSYLPRIDKLQRSIKRLKTTHFMFQDAIVDVLFSAKDYVEGKRDTDSQYGQDIKKIEENYKNFDKNYHHMVKNIFDTSDHIFIIQDYATPELMEKIRKSIDKYDLNLNVLLISDIRTIMLGANPTDIDIIWNNIQQIAFAKTLNPVATMVKFHPPYDNNTEQVKQFIKDINNENYIDGKNPTYNFIIKDIKKLSKYYNINKIFIDGKYQYISDKTIFIQPWAPTSSSETRLIIHKSELYNDFINYDIDEWSDKFYYYRFYRMYAYFPYYIEQFKKHNLKFEYDGCMDCCLEIQILSEHLSKVKHLTYQEIIEKLKDKSFCYRLLKLYDSLSIATYYRLRDNAKCFIHGWLNEKQKEVYVYHSDKNLENLYQMKITKETIDNTYMYKFTNREPLRIVPYHRYIKLSNSKSMDTKQLLKYLSSKTED